MSRPLDQLDLFSELPPPKPAPVPTIKGLHWYAPDGTPLVETVEWKGTPRLLPIRCVLGNVVWSGRGRVPFAWQTQFRSRDDAIQQIEADMVKRGYRRATA